VDGRRLNLKHAVIPAKAGIQADAPETPPGPMSRAMNIAALQAFPVDVRRQKSANGAK